MPTFKSYPIPCGARIAQIVELDQGVLSLVHVPLELGDHVLVALMDTTTGALVAIDIAAFALDEPLVLRTGTIKGKPYVFRMTQAERLKLRAAASKKKDRCHAAC